MIGQTNRQISKQRLELTVVFRQLVNIDFTWLNFFFFFSFAYFIQFYSIKVSLFCERREEGRACTDKPCKGILNILHLYLEF